MRTIFADCTVKYHGRGDTVSSRGTRLIILKADGTVLIHRDKGINAMNYMSGARKHDIREEDDEDGLHHIIAESNDETIDITIYEMFTDITRDDVDGDGDALERHGTEKQMQEWLTRSDVFPEVFDGKFLMREFDTGYGPVDLLGMSDDERLMLIEVKRNAKPNDVFQVMRYRDALVRRHETLERKGQDELDVGRDTTLLVPSQALTDPIMYLVSGKDSKKTREQCQTHDVRFVSIGREWVAEEKSNDIASKARTAG